MLISILIISSNLYLCILVTIICKILHNIKILLLGSDVLSKLLYCLK